jgi:hypothetical protein
MTKTELTRALHRISSWSAFDGHAEADANNWIERMIAANVQNGRDVAGAIINFPYMKDGAVAYYDRNTSHRARCDAMFAAFTKWQKVEA